MPSSISWAATRKCDAMGEKIYGLLGRKLGHSWSAPIHKALGCDSYHMIELEPEQLGDFLRREDIGGLNVTMPYKRDVMPFCDVIDEGAQAIGSVNTLVRRGGKLYGYNTDIDGFLYTARRSKIDFSGRKVLVLGSGGASLTAQAGARREGAREVVVISRSGPDSYESLTQRHRDGEILVNTTPVGMWPDLEGRPLDLRSLPRLEAALDVIYNPTRTSLLLQAKELGLRRAGGLPMLVTQAVRAEELFFEQELPSSENERILSQLWRDRTNLVLVGMPGCGKTAVGQALAQLSGRPLVDLDGEIVKRAGRPIPEMFAQEGEEAFRHLESLVLDDVCTQGGQVIATGGGAVLQAENRAAMRRTGRVYFLRRDLAQLPKDGRPLSQSGDLAEMYRLREPLYRAAADAEIDNNTTAAGAAHWVWRDFCEHSGD